MASKHYTLTKIFKIYLVSEGEREREMLFLLVSNDGLMIKREKEMRRSHDSLERESENERGMGIGIGIGGWHSHDEVFE